MKMYTNCKTSLSVDSWPPEGKDIQLLIIESHMSLLFGGQLSTDKKGLQFVYICIVPFPVWAGINSNSISVTCKIILSVDSWPLKRKDMQLLIQYLIRSCMSFLPGGESSTNKLVLQFMYIFLSSFSGLGWN